MPHAADKQTTASAPAGKERNRQPLWIRIAGPPETWMRAATLGVAAAVLTLAGSFLNFLNHYDYPVASSETALALAGILIASIILGLCGAAFGVFGRLLLATFLVALAIDVNFDSAMAVLLGSIASIVFARLSRQALILVFGVVVISQAWIAFTGGARPIPAAADNVEAAASANLTKSDLALVHIILDEHIGVEGIPDSMPRGAAMREQLREFYVGKGFRIFGGAYSEDLSTINAIPRALGLEVNEGDQGVVVEQNPYFDMLRSMGFRIDVAQISMIDFCDHPAGDGCATQIAGGLADIGDRLPASDKATLLVYRFVVLSKAARDAFSVYEHLALSARSYGLDLPHVDPVNRTRTSTLNGMANFDEMIGRARSLEPGMAMFAHILLPHYPYVYDKACGMRRLSDWLSSTSAVPREARYSAYFDQIVCTTRKVDELLAAVASSPAAGKTVFIIHGDHGSRIMEVEPTIENVGEFSDRDLVDAHSTLFAVSAPGIDPDYDTIRYPLRLLLDALVRSQFRAVAPELPADFTPTILIQDRERNPVMEWPVSDRGWWKSEPPEERAHARELMP